MLLLIALTHVRIKQRARVIIYYSIQSILEILSRTPSHTSLGSRFTNTYLRNIIIAKFLTNSYTISNFLQLKVINNLSTKLSTCLPYLIYVFIYLFIYLFYYLFILFIIIILYYIIPLTSKSYLRIFSIFDILYVYPKYIYYISI